MKRLLTLLLFSSLVFGSGGSQFSSGGGGSSGASTTLNNLTSPTAINQSLIMTSSKLIEATDGSSTAPSITFASTGAQDNGVYLDTTDTVGIAANGKKVATVDATNSFTYYNPANSANYVTDKVTSTYRAQVASGGVKNWGFTTDQTNGSLNLFPGGSELDLTAFSTGAFTIQGYGSPAAAMTVAGFSGLRFPNISSSCPTGSAGLVLFDTDNSCGAGTNKLIVYTGSAWAALH